MDWNAIHLITSSLNKFLEMDSIKENDLKIIQPKLDALFHILPLPKYYCIPARLERLTINERLPSSSNNRFDDIRYLKYPPPDCIKKYGRCNVINQSILYGAFHFSTALNEMKPEIGKGITHSKWSPKEELPLKMFPVFFITRIGSEPNNALSLDIKMLHQNFVSNFSEKDRKGFDSSMEFLAKCFAKEVAKDNYLDYFMSAYISKKIFDLEKIKFDGIIYPSVQTKLGFSNMALRPDVFDNLFKLNEVRYGKNSIEPGGSGINQITSRTTNFDLDKDLIIWDD